MAVIRVPPTERRPWTRLELLLAINLYCRIPFGRIHYRNPDIIRLAEKLGRTPGSLSYKLANFASIDPSLDRRGAVNVSKLDREVWKEFFDNWESMILESESQMARLFGTQQSEAEEALPEFPVGRTRESLIRSRVNQGFFRRMVLASYNHSCCITGMDNSELLVASHILPWSVDEANRLNPMNGLCLNALHDQAFDKGLISFDVDNRVLVSTKVRHDLIRNYEGTVLRSPKRFKPNPSFLEYHRHSIFQP